MVTGLAELALPDKPRLVQNLVWFARALRRAGLRIGPARTAAATQAVAATGFESRPDFYWALHACFVSRPQDHAVFDQIFRLYWRDPRYLEHMMSMLSPAVRGTQDDRRARPAERRAAEALLDGAATPDRPDDPRDDGETVIEIDASRTAATAERLRRLDFEQMSVAEMAQARRVLATLALPVPPLPGRRTAPDPAGRRLDAAATMRAARRHGGEVMALARRATRPRPPTLVALCDISGSMSQYSRAVLAFLHGVMNRRGSGGSGGSPWGPVHAFTFGTRLTNITRHLATRDVDAALAAAGRLAPDWEGGTRIAASLAAFNRDWSRRVMGQGAVVLLITDGLDRDDPVALAAAARRLHLTARRVIWVNPLLRYDGFAPLARGVAALLPHVDSLRAGHDIASVAALANALSRPEDGGERQRMMAALAPRRADMAAM